MLWVFLLFFAGVTLVVAEFFVPGMVCGFVGACCLFGGAIYGVVTYPDYGLWICLLYFLGTVAAIVGGVVIFPHTWAGRKMILSSGMAVEDGFVSDASDNNLVGQVGEVYSPLRPSGAVVVGDKRLQAVSSGEYIAKGERVRVLEVHGNRVIVELARDSASI